MTDLRELATDYVLGLLDPADRAALSARLEAPATAEDRALAAAVGAAQASFLPLDLTATEAPLAPDAWEKLAARLEGAAPAQSIAAPRARARPRDRGPGRWRVLALGAIAASLLLGIALAWRIIGTEAPAVMAVLLSEAGEAVAVIEAFDDDSVRITPLAGADTGPSNVLQVWTKPDADGAPVSLGILDTLRSIRLSGPDLPGPRQDQLYEITIEPEGGSPTGLPTGPIVGKGLARRPL